MYVLSLVSSVYYKRETHGNYSHDERFQNASGMGSFISQRLNSDLFQSMHCPRPSPSLNKNNPCHRELLWCLQYSDRRTLSPVCMLTGWNAPPFPLESDPTAAAVACNTFPWDVSGSIMAPLVTVSAALLSTSTRSNAEETFYTPFLPWLARLQLGLIKIKQNVYLTRFTMCSFKWNHFYLM
jgi:hypothetical protein